MGSGRLRETKRPERRTRALRWAADVFERRWAESSVRERERESAQKW
jgi:hypothetical protein